MEEENKNQDFNVQAVEAYMRGVICNEKLIKTYNTYSKIRSWVDYKDTFKEFQEICIGYFSPKKDYEKSLLKGYFARDDFKP